MQAILTKYIPATDTRGSRIKASCERGSITISYHDELSGDACHIAAADALVAKFVKEDAAKYGEHRNPWAAPRVCGGLADQSRVHVFSDMFNGAVVVQCANREDADRLVATARKAKADGQIAPLYKGLLGCVFQRANV